MKKIHFIFWSFLIFSCSETPTDFPVDSSIDVQFRVDMSNVINDGVFNDNDTISVILDSSEKYEMYDEDNDNLYTIIVYDLIIGKTYEYSYAINDSLENIDQIRVLTISDTENLILDYYQEINPTLLFFYINMSHQFDIGNFNPNTDYLDVAGTFNNWDGNEYHLVQGENYIYEIIISGLNEDDNIEYKFRINGSWDNAEFPYVPYYNRTYTVLNGNNIIELWYSDDQGN